MEILASEIVRILTQARDEIRANIANAGENASGRTSASLATEVYSEGIRLLFRAGDVAPMDTLEVGRPAGKVPYNITDIIYEWSLAKGLDWGNDKARRKIAAAVGWGRIRRFGTDRHENHVDIWRTPQQKAVAEVRKGIRSIIVGDIHETLSKLE